MQVCEECGHKICDLEEHVTNHCPECGTPIEREADFWADYKDFLPDDVLEDVEAGY